MPQNKNNEFSSVSIDFEHSKSPRVQLQRLKNCLDQKVTMVSSVWQIYIQSVLSSSIYTVLSVRQATAHMQPNCQGAVESSQIWRGLSGLWSMGALEGLEARHHLEAAQHVFQAVK